MKKLLGILVLGLLWCNVGFSKEIKIYYKDENRIELTWTPFYTRQAKIAAQHCAQYQKFASNFFGESPKKGRMLYHCSSRNLTISPTSGGRLYWTNYDRNHEFAKKKNER